MRAIVRSTDGPPDALEFEEVDRPVASDDEVLIRVVAAGMNMAEALRYQEEGHAQGKVVITVAAVD